MGALMESVCHDEEVDTVSWHTPGKLGASVHSFLVNKFLRNLRYSPPLRQTGNN